MRRLVALGAVLALAGCGDDASSPPAKVLDTAKVERSITDSIKAQRNLNAQVVCPTGIAQEKGLSFACLATYKGGTTTFTVEQTDDAGNVTYEGQ